MFVCWLQGGNGIGPEGMASLAKVLDKLVNLQLLDLVSACACARLSANDIQVDRIAGLETRSGRHFVFASLIVVALE